MLINKLDLMGSSSCDLKCSYCYITKNCSFYNYDSIVKEAWKSGSYLTTIKQVFQKLDADPTQVKDLEFWGGEPTLHIKEMASQGKALGQLFPEVDFVLIPTNWYQINMQELVNFIYNFNDGVSPRLKNISEKVNFHLQLSIDGPPGDFNTYGHKVPWDTYKKQFDDFCFYLKEKENSGKQLNNVNIIFAISGTSQQKYILKNLNTLDKIKEFQNYIKKVCKYVNDELKQFKNIDIFLGTPIWTPTIAIPDSTSIEEALELNKIVLMLEYSDYINGIKPYTIDANEIQSFHATYGELNILERNHECPESNEHAITLMPDGTIAECPCTFLQNLDSYKQELLNNKQYWEYKSCLIRDGSFYNPLLGDKKLDDYHNWYVYGGGFIGTNSTYASLNLNMAYEMALSRQIDYNYALNPELLMKHYMGIFTTAECYRENVNVTHNHFLTDHNVFRRWYNGHAELGYKDHREKIKKIMENVLKGEN